MSGYTKLFSSIVTSTIWREPDHVRLVWVTMLALADRFGVIEASVPGLADMARVSREDCDDALRVLSDVDPDSRTKEAGGRRIELVDGGWKLINHAKYREKMSDADRREKNAAYMREYRERKDQRKECKPTVITSDDPSSRIREVEHAEAEAEANQKAEREPEPARAPAIPGGTWSGYDWYRRFGAAWCSKYKTLTHGQGPSDAKAIGQLGDTLQAMPFDERVAVQLMAPEMIAEYLNDESPGRVKARHPWKWFVEGFNGLRAPKIGTNVAPGANGAATGPSPKRSDYCDDHIDGRSKLWSTKPTASCPECKHQRAKYPKHPRVVSMEELFAKETG